MTESGGVSQDGNGQRQTHKVLANVVASSTCIAAAVIVFNPLDCLRVRWQVEPRGGAPSLLAFAQRTIRTEGLVKGLWQPGLMANATAAAGWSFTS